MTGVVCGVSLHPSAVVMVCLLRYAQVIEHSHQCWVNTSALVSGCTNALGLVMVGNFQVKQHTPSGRSRSGCFLLSACLTASVRQVDHAKSLHYVGAGVAFPAGLLFVCLQCVLTYRVAVTALDYWMAHFRVALTLGALVSLILSILEQLGPSFRRRSHFQAHILSRFRPKQTSCFFFMYNFLISFTFCVI